MIIDAYFKAKPKIIEKIKEDGFLEYWIGKHERTFEYDIFNVYAEFTVKSDMVDSSVKDVDIDQLTITWMTE